VSDRESFRNTLTYAVSIAGSERDLALRLNVPLPLLMNWLSGIEAVPPQIFLQAVDVVLGATPAEIARSRNLLVRAPAGSASS
jgi:DNA-binding transcriptional regulator YdaS (Cro superfamily)